MNLAPSYLHCNERKPGVLLVCDIRNELTFEESLEAVEQFKREILEEAVARAQAWYGDEEARSREYTLPGAILTGDW